MSVKKPPRFAEADSCYDCTREFTFLLRRHHCRHCGQSFCKECASNFESSARLGILQPERACNYCFKVLQLEKKAGCGPDLDSLVPEMAFDFDLIIIGGGSGGLACSKEAAKYGARVAVCDYVAPSPQGTTWGLGGTCVNVGCIPKKLFHQAGLLHHSIEDAVSFGWKDAKAGKHDWATLVSNTQKYIQGLNRAYMKQLHSENVRYYNALAQFVSPHAVQLTDSKGQQRVKTARRFVIACGGRPTYPDIPGAKEYGITSDDIFMMKRNPGHKVLVVGASYVALECAGFLTSLGHDVTVMVRSILLRGFDQDMAKRIGDYMEKCGTKFARDAVPLRIECLDQEAHDKAREDSKEAKEGVAEVAKGPFRVVYKIRLSAQHSERKAPERKEGELGGQDEVVEPLDHDESKEGEEGKEVEREEVFDTVLFATGRTPVTAALNLGAVNVKTNDKGKITVFREQTNVPHIYAIGDAVDYIGAPNAPLELTPVAIQAGRLLARRLYLKGFEQQMDYKSVPTTVFTPIEYGAIGLTEDEAIEQLGKDNVDVWHTSFQPVELTLPGRLSGKDGSCYGKLICDRRRNGRVVGFHYLGPYAGEITQGFAVAIKCRATKADFDVTIGIHPTIAEKFTTLSINKTGGGEAVAKPEGC